MKQANACTRTLSISDVDDYGEVVEAREACGCLVCLHSIAEARRRARMSEQTTLPMGKD